MKLPDNNVLQYGQMKLFCNELIESTPLNNRLFVKIGAHFKCMKVSNSIGTDDISYSTDGKGSPERMTSLRGEPRCLDHLRTGG